MTVKTVQEDIIDVDSLLRSKTSNRNGKKEKTTPDAQIEIDETGRFEYGYSRWATREYLLDLGIAEDQLDSALCRSGIELAKTTKGEQIYVYQEQSVKEKLDELGYGEAAAKIRSRVELEQELDQYVQGDEEFRTLIELLGASNAVDILFTHRKDFRGVAVDVVERIIGKHLGDFLMNTGGGLKPRDVKKVLPYLHIQRFANAFFEVFKDACLTEFVEIRGDSAALSDREILRGCTKKYEDEFSRRNFMKNEHLAAITNRVKEYFESVFNDFIKPESIVDRLSCDREFPDINQLINVREISEKKRFLKVISYLSLVPSKSL